jgi:hypothetical protein
MRTGDMYERKLFWLGFIGGILRIFSILMFLFTAYAAIGVWGLADWRGVPPVLIILALASGAYFSGKKLEAISESVHNKKNEINTGSDAAP